MKIGLLIAAAVAACGYCAAANAEDTGSIDGLLSAGYSYTDFNGTNIDSYDIGGTAKYGFGNAYNIQGNFAYNHTELAGVNFNQYGGGGAVFWRDQTYAAGAFGQYSHIDIVGASANYGTYGLVGEWYGDSLTVRTHIAGLSADGGDGAFGGGGVAWYVMPDLSLNADGSFNNLATLHWGEFKFGAEYLVSHEVPISIGASWVHTMYTSGPNTDGVMVSLTWHIGDRGSLIDLDRSGPLRIEQPALLPF